MKKIFLLCTVTAMALLLAACGGPNTLPEASNNSASSETASAETAAPSDASPPSSGSSSEESDTAESTEEIFAFHPGNSAQELQNKSDSSDFQTSAAATFSSPDSAAPSPTASSSTSKASVTTRPTQAPSATQPSSSRPTWPTQSKPTADRPSSSSSAATATKPTVTPMPVDKAEQVTALVNAQRAKAGLSPLTLDKELSANAAVRAEEIVNHFAHTRPNGSSFSTAITISYRRAGENIAYGYPTAEAVMNGWMNSEGHRANILQSSFTKIGVGVVQKGSTLYWVQLFTG